MLAGKELPFPNSKSQSQNSKRVSVEHMQSNLESNLVGKSTDSRRKSRRTIAGSGNQMDVLKAFKSNLTNRIKDAQKRREDSVKESDSKSSTKMSAVHPLPAYGDESRGSKSGEPRPYTEDVNMRRRRSNSTYLGINPEGGEHVEGGPH